MRAISVGQNQGVLEMLSLELTNRSAGGCRGRHRCNRCANSAGRRLKFRIEAAGIDVERAAQRDHATDEISQLPHIAGPVVRLEFVDEIRLKPWNSKTEIRGKLLSEMSRKHRNVVAPFAQRRQRQWNDVQAVEKVSAELTTLHHGRQRNVGGCDYPYVDVHRTAFAESLELDFPILSDPDKTVAKDYGVINPARGFAYRWTFYIDKSGKISDIDKHINTTKAGKDVAAKLKELGVAEKK